MQITEKASLDSRGRLLLPMKIRKYFNLFSQKEVLLIGDLEEEIIKIYPFTSWPSKFVLIKIIISDEIGTLSKIIDLLSEIGINFKETRSETLINGKRAEMKVIADIKNCPKNEDEIIEMLLEKKDLVISVEIRNILD
jgi:bifunctional DNA-binding transcriptional regulator/antitoxin component of YhaV-PrlF toxin-antitoxin module